MLQNLVGSYELILGDKGYEGADRCLTPWKEGLTFEFMKEDKTKFNSVLNSARAKIENAFSRMKTLFGILNSTPKNIFEIHDITWCCANLTNIDIMFSPLREGVSCSLFQYLIQKNK